ncbi:MAG: radical SAM protein [Dehalococcoidia bacterium]|nr:radical SAM protein [Dehalococcoidia bacterium]
MLASCRLCPRECGINRLEGAQGKCRTGRQALVASFGPHFGEESPLVGRNGSGTIFFTYCNLKCRYCQNYTISQSGDGSPVDSRELARMMLSLQRSGCHNINFVSPTHVVPQLLEGLEIAVEAGLSVPLVYNTGGYDSVQTLRMLDGIFDIYMPDMKYCDDETGLRLSGVKRYPERNREAVREMHRQTGDLQIDDNGVAVKGLLVRHLVLPHNLAGTAGVCSFLATEVSRNTYLNIMGQYRPCHEAYQIPELGRPVSGEELARAVRIAHEHGLNRLDRVESRFVAKVLKTL